ncbi:hypothetical protein NDU88_001958 [Pleurodeles waltl]|uniref:Uncharacterized protein n=1 Tax=Pleurodeles waltl TaxID=8319 RepID=A0AAV7NCM1_PLEWA|nr:hypothetical protein NDU88_001958 [Pleurodeles waltl]
MTHCFRYAELITDPDGVPSLFRNYGPGTTVRNYRFRIYGLQSESFFTVCELQTNARAQPDCLTFTTPETMTHCFRYAELITDPDGVPSLFRNYGPGATVRNYRFRIYVSDCYFSKDLSGLQ